jgi:hypothetical protein
MLLLKQINGRTASAFRTLGAVTAREKRYLLSEILQVRGLMPLLMKPRNGARWNLEDREALATHVKRLSQLSPYLVVVVMPGGFFMLPALSWWLDRRRRRNTGAGSAERPL